MSVELRYSTPGNKGGSHFTESVAELGKRLPAEQALPRLAAFEPAELESCQASLAGTS